MRSIEHPGPVHPTRVHCVPATVRAVDVELPRGVTLLQGLADAVRAQGATSAVFSLREGTLAPMAFVMPALSDSPKHVAYFSERFEAHGAARIESGSITFGLRDGEPSLHCHATWIESDGRRRSGHVLASESRVELPVRLDAWMLDGAAFEVAPDAETNFNLLQVSANAASLRRHQRPGGPGAAEPGSLPGAGSASAPNATFGGAGSAAASAA